MNAFLRFILSQRVFFNLLYWGLLVYGIVVAIPNLPVERYPNINFGEAAISTSYPGASSEEVERLVTKEIEDSLRGMENIEFVRSSSKSGFSNVNIKFIDDTDYDQLYEELRLRVLGIQNRLPVMNGKPLTPQFNVTTVDDWLPVIQVNLMSSRSEQPLAKKSLARLTEELQLKFEAIEGVKEVVLSGREIQQFTLALRGEALKHYGLSVFEIQQALLLGGGSLPVGSLDTPQGELKLKIDDRYRTLEDLLKVVVRQDGKSSQLLLGEILDLQQCGLEKIQGGVVTTVNGRDTVSCKITKMSQGNAKTIKAKVLEQLDDFKRTHANIPIEFNTTLDSTIKIDNGLGVLQSSLAMSLVLVMLAIFLFLTPSRRSTTLWVMGISLGVLLVMMRYNDNSAVQLWALGINTVVIFATCRAAVLTVSGIAFSFIGCLLMFHLCGYSLNEITLLAFVLTSGILVDDAIVVLENIQSWKDRGVAAVDAAIYGTAEVFWPVVSASLTTIAAFMPMLLMTGATGEFFSLIPITVSAALGISLFESLLLLPIHFVDLEHFDRRKTKPTATDLPTPIPATFLVAKMTRIYDVSLAFCNAHPTKSILGVLCLFFLSVGIMAQSIYGPSQGYTPLLKLKFFPDDTSNIQIQYRNPSSSTLEATDQLGRSIARDLLERGPTYIKSVTANAGITIDSAYKPIFGSQLGFMMVELPDRSERQFENANTFIDEIRQDLEARYEKDGVELEITGQKDGPPVGAPVHVRCSGVMDENIHRLGEDLENHLRSGQQAHGSFDGLIDLKSDRESRTPTLVFKTQGEAAARYGLTKEEVRQFVATLFEGAYVGDMRLVDEDVPIRMKLATVPHRRVEDALQLPIVQRQNHEVYYNDVGEFNRETSAASLERRNYQRVLNITANIREDSRLQARDFIANIQSWYLQHKLEYPGTEISFGGEAESTAKSYSSLISAFGLALFLIYGILAVQFHSYSQPMLIMSNIVFSCIGVVLMLGGVGALMLVLPSGHIAPERSMVTVQSFIAMVGLTGLVVNDAIVLIDFINQERRRGLSLEEAVKSGTHSRLRPIVMTTWSTIAGLLPLAIGIPEFSITWGPFATCFIAGLSVSTLITLLIVPILYQWLENFKISWRRPQLSQNLKAILLFSFAGVGWAGFCPKQVLAEDIVPPSPAANVILCSSSAYNLQESLDLCLKNQPRLQASRFRELSAKYQATADTSAFRPQLSMSAQSGYQDAERTRLNPLGNERYVSAHLQLEQYLYGFGWRQSALQVAEQSVEMRRIASEEISSLLKLELRQAFATALWMKEKWLLAELTAHLTETEWKIAEEAFKVGSFSETEFRQSRNNHRSSLIVVQQAKLEYHSSLLKLEALTGVSPCEPKGSLGEAKTYLDPDKFDLEPNLGELKGSASVRYLQRLCSLAKSRASSYRKSQYPQLKGVLSSDRMGESWSDGQNDWRAGLQLSWSPDLQNSARSRAYGEEEEALACTQDIENMLRARVEQWKNLKLEQSTLSEQLALQIEILLDSDENYKAILQSYKLGRVVVTKVEEARLVTTRAKLDDLQLKWRRDLLVYRWQRWLE